MERAIGKTTKNRNQNKLVHDNKSQNFYVTKCSRILMNAIRMTPKVKNEE